MQPEPAQCPGQVYLDGHCLRAQSGRLLVFPERLRDPALTRVDLG